MFAHMDDDRASPLKTTKQTETSRKLALPEMDEPLEVITEEVVKKKVDGGFRPPPEYFKPAYVIPKVEISKIGPKKLDLGE